MKLLSFGEEGRIVYNIQHAKVRSGSDVVSDVQIYLRSSGHSSRYDVLKTRSVLWSRLLWSVPLLRRR